MRDRLIGVIVGIVLMVGGAFTVGCVVGSDRATQEAAEAVEQARLVYEERTAADDHNGDVLESYVNGEISEDDAAALMVPTERKTTFIAFTEGSGTITFGIYDPEHDPHSGRKSPWGTSSCVVWAGENNYNCGTAGSTVKCVIFVKRSSGPMAGTTFYGKSCDGIPISKRATVGGKDGYIITYDFSKFIPKPR